MTKQIAGKLMIATILIGVIMLGLNTLFGNNTVTYLSEWNHNGITYYKIDFFGYIENIRTAFQNVPQMSLSFGTRTWQTPTNWLDIPTNWGILINNMAFMLDVFILPINAFLYTLRIPFYLIKMILAFLGIPVIQGTYSGNPLEWLITLCNFMIYNLEIPLI